VTLQLDPAVPLPAPEAETGPEGRWCVIGAGFAGLAMASELQRRGVPFTVLEQERALGGNWHSGVYAGVHMISSKRTTQMSNLPMPAAFPDFPSAAQVRAYLEQYADHFRLRPHIQFDAEVARLEPVADGGAWRVQLAGGAWRTYAGVVVCNGHDWAPRMPRYPGRATLDALHSRAYKDPAALAGRRVLVVGGGNSACDIAVQAARVGAGAAIALRRGYWFIPRMLFGRPIAEVFCHWAPYWAQQAWIGLGLAVVFGGFGEYGLLRPSHTLFDHPVSVSEHLFQEVKKGRLAVRRDVARIDGKTVTFVDGVREDFDLVVYGTGYHAALPMIEHLVEYREGIPQLLHGMIHPVYKNLFLLGFGQARSGCGPLLCAGAAAVMAFIEAQARMTLPLGRVMRLTGSRPKRRAKNSEEVIIDPHKAFAQARLVCALVAPLAPFWERLFFDRSRYRPEATARAGARLQARIARRRRAQGPPAASLAHCAGGCGS